MLRNKIAILGASMVLTLGLVSTNSYAGVHHHVHAKTVCHGNLCHKWVKNVTRTCHGGRCHTHVTHRHWTFHR